MQVGHKTGPMRDKGKPQRPPLGSNVQHHTLFLIGDVPEKMMEFNQA